MRMVFALVCLVLGALLVVPGYTAPFGILLMLVGVGLLLSMLAGSSRGRSGGDDGTAGTGGHAPGA